ncbi:hypothetical protein LshimejAT787_2000360 [Lyophyllum shimeji]|uniref:CCHC-type domain-containing protein n=1 Tax=Lyophyllum shimeji TaxID=47721 RepID=A0A9P3UWI3_LYOSH|nr:hypothetical protein LshimejAT787_2000360 [Lyophyllum shimeji]
MPKEEVTLFRGDYSGNEKPYTWFRRLEGKFDDTTTLSVKLYRFEKNLDPGRRAELWFQTLPAEEICTITDALEDDKGHLIPDVRCGLPLAVRRILPSHITTWAIFLAEIETISLDRITDELEALDPNHRSATNQAAPWSYNPQFEPPPILPTSSHEPKLPTTTTTPTDLPAPTPTPRNPRGNETRQNTQRGPPNERFMTPVRDENPFITSTPVAPSSLFFPRTPNNASQTPSHPGNEELAKRAVELSVVYQLTQEGIELYNRILAACESQHAPAHEVDFITPPYPLTPGTVNIGSKECFKCGQKGHISRDCVVDAARQVNQLVHFPWDVSSVENNTPLVLAYDVPILETLLQLSSSNIKNPEKSQPFLQRIRLIGPNETMVRATGQVDDGVMRNCISKCRWLSYSHCLGVESLTPSHTRIGVANGAEAPSMGKWTGTVKVGGTELRSTFEVFDCGNAFDVILGKPWLRQMRAVHDYETDLILLCGPKSDETIANHADSSGRHTTPEVLTVTQLRPKGGWCRQDVYEAEKALREEGQTKKGMQEREKKIQERKIQGDDSEQAKNVRRIEDPEREMADEWVRIHLIQDSEDPWAETRWGAYLTDTENAYPDREHKSVDEWLH